MWTKVRPPLDTFHAVLYMEIEIRSVVCEMKCAGGLMDGRDLSYLRSLSKEGLFNRCHRPPLLETPVSECRKHGAALMLGRYLSHCDDFLFHIMPFLLVCFIFNCALHYRDEGTRISLNIDEFWGCGQYRKCGSCCKEERI
jgi:hypothetical protein